MAERPQNPRPMVRCAAGLDPDHRRRKRLEEGYHLLAPQLLTQNHLLGGVHPVKLEKMLRRIHANSANLFHGRSPLSEICNDLILAQSMPSGAVHPITRICQSVPMESAHMSVWCWPDAGRARCEAIRRLIGLLVTPRSAPPVPRHHRPQCLGTARCS